MRTMKYDRGQTRQLYAAAKENLMDLSEQAQDVASLPDQRLLKLTRRWTNVSRLPLRC